MALSKEQIEHTLEAGWSKRGQRKYMKNCINRIIRRFCKKIDVEGDTNFSPKKRYRGWEL